MKRVAAAVVPALPRRRGSAGRGGTYTSRTDRDPAVARHLGGRRDHARDRVGDGVPSGTRRDQLGGHYAGAARHGDVRRVHAASCPADRRPASGVGPASRVRERWRNRGGRPPACRRATLLLSAPPGRPVVRSRGPEATTPPRHGGSSATSLVLLAPAPRDSVFRRAVSISNSGFISPTPPARPDTMASQYSVVISTTRPLRNWCAEMIDSDSAIVARRPSAAWLDVRRRRGTLGQRTRVRWHG